MIAAIVQARMTSTRLPGKVLLKVMGRPLLSYQIERLRRINNIDNIIIATTTNRDDDPIVELCNSESVFYFRGSENDVLDRYYQAAKKFGVNDIMRITADCPLIDPEICSRVVNVYLESGVEYVNTGMAFAEGVDCELMSFRYLEKAFKEAGLKSEKEHVTLYMHNHPDLFMKITLANKSDDSKYRFTVDEKVDFLVVKEIIENLYKTDNPPFTTDEIKRFLDEHPETFKMNENIIRNEGLIKSLQKDSLLLPGRKDK